MTGAVLQHEYQWEVAARTGAISDFSEGPYTLRGGCLHTQPALRRASLRQGAPVDLQAGFCGARLVFPPGVPFWENVAQEVDD